MRQLICGKNSVLDAIKNKLPILIIYTTRPHELIGFSRVKHVSKDFLDRTTTENHQGFIAELEVFSYSNLPAVISDKPEKVLILDHIQDPHNLGAILRNANAFEIKHIIIPRKRSTKVNATVIKVSSGGYVGLKIAIVSSLVHAVTKLKENGFWIYATGVENGVNFRKTTYNKPLAIVFGNESMGVSRPLLKHCDQIIRIKTKGIVQSLNVAVATGIILSEL